MTPQKAVEKFWEYYFKAGRMDFVKNPVAWALYKVWKQADGERKDDERTD